MGLVGLSIQVNDWITTVSEDKILYFKSPIEMIEHSDEAITSTGTIPITLFKSLVKDSMENSYNLVYYDLPQPIAVEDDSLFIELRDEIINGMMTHPLAKLDYQRDDESFGLYTSTFRITYDDAYSCKSKVICNGKQIVTAQCISPKNKSLNNNIDRFLSSVKLKQ